MSRNTQPSIQDNEYTVWPEMDAQEVHTPEHPFCWDMSCPCHEDQDAIVQTTQDVTDGLMSTGDADRHYRGKTV